MAPPETGSRAYREWAVALHLTGAAGYRHRGFGRRRPGMDGYGTATSMYRLAALRSDPIHALTLYT